jgi:hypothetical protein
MPSAAVAVDQILVVVYSQDIAFQFLSLFTNLLALIHQVVFGVLIAVSERLRRSSVLEIVASNVSPVIIWAVIVSVWLALAGYAVFAVGAIWTLLGVFALTIGVGGVCLLVFGSVVVNGLLRIVVFSLLGVLEQQVMRGAILNALLFEVVVSMVPEGTAQVAQITGSRMFNHAIYENPQAMNQIASYVERRVAVAG